MAASPDLSHVVLDSSAELVEGVGAHENGLFDASGGALKFIGVGEVGAGNKDFNSPIAAGARDVSADGRVIFTGSSEGKSGLLLRDTAREETVQLAPSGAIFLTASTDDSRVFFTSVTGGPLEECVIIENGEGRLQCNGSGKPADLSEGKRVFAPIPGASEDASYVYFVSEGVLSGAETDAHGEQAQAGQPNLYLLHEGATRLVAVLSASDSPDWGSNEYLAGANSVQVPQNALLDLTARVSPDGRWVAFSSQRSLTGYDNHDALSGQLDQEVFLYHAPAVGGEPGSLQCASCNPTGGRPHGIEVSQLIEAGQEQVDGGDGKVWPAHTWLAASLPGWSTRLYQSRYLSNGGRLFFNSADALVPHDANNTVDVYEYEPATGAGAPIEAGEAPAGDSCTASAETYSAASRGCTDLISSGTSSEHSAFLDASENGQDVFFLTTAPLSKRDHDSAYDVYDAHVNGSEPELLVPAETHTEPVQPPEAQTPGSLSFSGPGNLLAQPIEVLKPRVETAKEKRAKRLASSLRLCRKKRDHHRREACERQARKRYGAKTAGRAKRAGNHRRAGR